MTVTTFSLALASDWTGIPSNSYQIVPWASLTIEDTSLMSLNPTTHQLTMHAAAKLSLVGQLWIVAGIPTLSMPNMNADYVGKYQVNGVDKQTGIGGPNLLFPGTGVVQPNDAFAVALNDVWQLNFYGTTASSLTINSHPAHTFISGMIFT